MANLTNTQTCGEAIVSLLEKYGVEIVFGIPGVHTLELYRGLVGSKIRHVLPRHEQGAGFMADGYARATGKPGVCFLITGPGVTNAATPIAQAYSDSVPMLVISSVNETDKLGRGLGELHEMPDQLKMTSAFTAFSARADNPEDFPDLLAKAFAVFSSSRPRPVHIEVPIDIFAKPVTEAWKPAILPNPKTADHDLLKAAAEKLETAAFPLIVAGGGAIGGEAALLSLVEKLGSPVVETVAGSGMLPSSHPLSLGSTLVSKSTHDLIKKADVVLAVGTELADTETWGIDFSFNGSFIRVDIDPKQFSNSYQADLNIEGDAPHTLIMLDDLVRAQVDPNAMADRAQKVAKAKADFDTSLSEEENLRRNVFEAIVGAAPDDALIVADMTQIGYTGHTVFRSETSGRFFNPTGYGTLGYALPAGIGAKLGSPHKAVIVLVGDGGLQYTLQEMATAAEEGIPIVVILWNNDLLKQIHEGFVDFEIEPIAVFPKNPDFQLLAKSFGWRVEKVTELTDLAPAVSRAIDESEENKVPVMIEVLENELQLEK